MAKEKTKSLLRYYGFTPAEQKKYSVVAGILRELTPERVEKEIEKIKNMELPPELQKWVREYEEVGERNKFIWKLFLYGIKNIDYIDIDNKYKKLMLKAQFLVAMLVVMLDDAADVRKDGKLLRELLKIIYDNDYTKCDKFSQEKRSYVNFFIKIWNNINKLIKSYPYYKNFKENFNFDIEQMANAIEFDYITSQNPYFINKLEYWTYSFNTMYFVFTDNLYLMCVKNFATGKISNFRNIFWRAKKMVRIGNWIGTWEKEIRKGDFSSGVFACAIDLKIIHPKDLENKNYEKIIKKIKKRNIENELLKEWEDCYKIIYTSGKNIKVININSLLRTLKKLLFLELINKNYK